MQTTGAYLHGSRSRGDHRPDSDLDVIVLVDAGTSADGRSVLARELTSTPGPRGIPLDHKVIPIDVFAPDPWIDLSRARWLGGRRWHEELPPRSLDDAAHESLGVLRVLLEDGAFDTPDPDALRKPAGRLASVLAALVAGIAPTGPAEAIRILRSHEPSDPTRWVLALADETDAAPGNPVPELAEHARRAVHAVLGELRRQRESGLLGPRCTAAATAVLDAYDRH